MRLQLMTLATASAAVILGCASTPQGQAPNSARNLGGSGLPIHGNFCGPNIPTTTSRTLSGQIAELEAILPIDDIDKACKAHDICYANQGFGAAFCDTALINTTGAFLQAGNPPQNTRNTTARKRKEPSFQCTALALAILGYFETTNPSAVSSWADRLVANTATHVAVGYTSAGLKAYEYTYKALFLLYAPVIFLLSNGSLEKTKSFYETVYSAWDSGMYAGRWERCDFT